MVIRHATETDRSAIWCVIERAVRAGETYALPRDMSEEAALGYWLSSDHEPFVAEEDGQIVGTYYMRPNQVGGGAHIANCGYMTAPAFSGRGVARAMCAHSLKHARDRGFRAMQFNFVVSTNERAVSLWQSFGFQIVGRVPEAFEHPRLGFVDVLIMYCKL
jgi:ribosomal protein S18 acetylase RimI-like enzyme